MVTTIGHAIAANDSSLVGVHFLSENREEAKIMIATTLAFLVGLIQISLAIIHAGVVTKYLSDAIVAGFTTGAAYHIVVSQLGAILGIALHHDTDNPFKLTDVRRHFIF